MEQMLVVTIYSTNYSVTVNPLPSAASNITGTAKVCQGQNGVAYSVPLITNATGYTWNLPTGATIATGSNTNSITVDFSSTASSGNITVYGTNACGSGTTSPNYSITVNPLPSSAGVITGTATVCQGQNGVAYTLPAISNATGYVWTLPAGATIASGSNTNSITVNFAPGSATGNITVYGTNSCGNGTVSPAYPVTVDPLPSAAGSITGTATVCQAESGVSYSVAAISNASSYVWSYSGSGATITGTTNSISINFSSIASSGNLTVLGTNLCGDGVVSADYPITVSPLPDAAGLITGSATVCQGSTGVAYSVPLIANASSYTWTLPSGGTIASGANTNSITVNYSASSASGNVTVYGTNACGDGTVSAGFAVTVNPLPDAAGSITGSNTVCQGTTGVAYSVPAIANATNYVWSLPTGASITSGTGTNSIILNFSAVATTGNMTVYGVNGCGVGSTSPAFTITINPIPVAAGTITGSASVCSGSTGVAYSVAPITNAVGYVWSLPLGATIASGGNTNNISVDFSLAAVPGSIAVYGTNGCGSGTLSPNYSVSINPLPAANAITGTSAICAGSTLVAYGVTTDNSATASYAWSYSGTNATLSSVTGASITIDFADDATSGILTVVETFTATGCSTTNTYAITVDPLPAANAITGTSAICAGSTLVAYGVTTDNSATASYAWSYSGTNATLSSVTGASITIDFADDATSGILTVVETFTATGCSTTNTYAITVDPLPAANAITGTSAICAGSTLVAYGVTTDNSATSSYAWSYSGTNATLSSVTGASITIDFADDATSGTLTVVETFTATGCSTTNTYVITVNTLVPVSVAISEDVNPICSGEAVTITATPVNEGSTPSYQWLVNGSNAGNDSPILSYVPADGDIITVVLTSSETCQSW